jgi:hypothetical protein
VGTVVQAAHRFRSEPDLWLSKKEIAQKLSRSVRWVEMRAAEGMPSEMIGICRMFREPDVREWLQGYERAKEERRQVRLAAEAKERARWAAI